MPKRRLGNSGVDITTIGLGTWAIGGGDNPYGWGPQDDQSSIETIHKAIDLGINWLDTAKGYGHGHSEEIVGRALKGKRDQMLVATKCGVLWQEDGSDIYVHLKADSIKSECESSLKRLQTDHIDLYQVHWPNDEDLEEAWGAIADLIKEGKVRFAGASNFNVDQLKLVQAIHPVTSLQPPYSMLERGIEAEILPYCKENDIGVIAYSPMQAGLLTGKMTAERVADMPEDDWRRNSPHFQGQGLEANLALVEKLQEIAQAKGYTAAHLALAWVLRAPVVTGAIAGARNPAQIEETAKAGDWALSGEEIQLISDLLTARDKEIE
ncbi:MAG: aldo/keto reductase [Chloroflexi bacterium]|nr:MAG: aldo/keto reductase [Chloroflexota bacterium]MBL1193812.1 aldo/keto reductase [Chloroflexota bacterium]NOH11105.1 aldo/keto reductase [Chloroflexota bacterium]